MEIGKQDNTLSNTQPDPKFEERVKYRSIGTGKYLPDKWLLYHQDETASEDATEQYIIDEFGIEFKNYCLGTESGKVHKVPGGASNSLHLDE